MVPGEDAGLSFEGGALSSLLTECSCVRVSGCRCRSFSRAAPPLLAQGPRGSHGRGLGPALHRPLQALIMGSGFSPRRVPRPLLRLSEPRKTICLPGYQVAAKGAVRNSRVEEVKACAQGTASCPGPLPSRRGTSVCRAPGSSPNPMLQACPGAALCGLAIRFTSGPSPPRGHVAAVPGGQPHPAVIKWLSERHLAGTNSGEAAKGLSGVPVAPYAWGGHAGCGAAGQEVG